MDDESSIPPSAEVLQTLSTFHTELTLPAHLLALPLAQAYMYQVGRLAGLSPAESDTLVLAVEEACTNTIEHSYDGGESGTLTLSSDLTLQALCISVRDHGLPFDESVAPVYHPPTDIDDAASSGLHGLGLELIHRAVDEFRWISHGSKGKELQLIKYMAPGHGVRALPVPIRPEPAVAAGAVAEDARAHHYIIRRMLPEDALRVCQCFYRTFGYSYEEDFYSPERLTELNRAGELISVVALDEGSGEIVGHVALTRPPGSRVGERTHLVVVPEHRGHGLRERMGNALELELSRLGIAGTYGLAVTTHTISQKASESRGMVLCGINPGLGMPYHFKAIQPAARNPLASGGDGRKLSQRESLVYYFKYLIPAPPTRVHVPERHERILTHIYEGLGVAPEFCRAAPPNGQGLVTIIFTREENLGEIQVQRVGADSLPEIRRARRDLCEIGSAEVVFLDLPLAQSGTPDLCSAAEEDGFVFCGIRPYSAPDGDYLRLVYLGVELDLDGIQLCSPFGRQLLEYIRAALHAAKRRDGEMEPK